MMLYCDMIFFSELTKSQQSIVLDKNMAYFVYYPSDSAVTGRLIKKLVTVFHTKDKLLDYLQFFYIRIVICRSL